MGVFRFQFNMFIEVLLSLKTSITDREIRFRCYQDRISISDAEEIDGKDKDGIFMTYKKKSDAGVSKIGEVIAESVVDIGESVEEVVKPKTAGETYSIVVVSSEAVSYSKTGGLGDVCGSLPIALAARGHRVMVVSPRYVNGSASDKIYKGALDAQCRIKIPCFEAEHEVAFFHEYRAGVDWVFVDHPSYHRPGNPYADQFGAYGDNQVLDLLHTVYGYEVDELLLVYIVNVMTFYLLTQQFRFTLLSHAACEAPLLLPLGGFTYEEKCMFLVNDWHASLVPVLLASKYRPYGVYKDARSIVAIHNLAHQGVEPAATYKNFGLPTEWHGALEWVFPTWERTHGIDTGEAVNIMKGAIVTADRILTVSKGYAWEITIVEGGYGLDGLISSRESVLDGITNGIDVDEWDPSSDVHIPFHYSIDDLSGKITGHPSVLYYAVSVAQFPYISYSDCYL
ncbi:hypothetical protein MKW92_019765 [Papaver armeniacum]|nr:hypothetical protein MKW92_019765 [Papaver armeniacum]